VVGVDDGSLIFRSAPWSTLLYRLLGLPDLTRVWDPLASMLRLYDGRVANPAPRQDAWWNAFTADPRHGPLPGLVLGLTVVTGLVDAVSILSLGRVFVANMTGNVVFVGFAVAGAPGFSLSASLFALAGFAGGAFGGGLLIDRSRPDRALLLRNSLLVEVALLVVATAVSASSRPFGSAPRDAIAALIAVAMGMQNATARRLAVPDLTTTVLTMTLTGIAADLRARNRAVVARRLLAVTTMLTGAVIGAVLVLHVQPLASLALATGLLAGVALLTAVAARGEGSWRS
jgi:uncharacterized membrane protein YoaK (UPF0700 family)